MKALQYLEKVSQPAWKRRNFVRAMRELDKWAREHVRGEHKFKVCHNFFLILSEKGAFLEREEPGRHEFYACSELTEDSPAVRGYLMYELKARLPKILEEVRA